MSVYLPLTVMVISAAYLSTLGCGEPHHKKVEHERMAPYFTASTAQNKTYNLKSLTQKRPVFLYMIQASCGINAKAVRYYEAMFKAYKDKPNFIGLFDGNAKAFQAWQKVYKVSFPVLLDPNLKVIHAYHSERSPWLFKIGTDGKILNEWKGYSISSLEELNKLLAQNAGMPVQKVSFKGAPTQPSYG